jgi:cytochrome c553
LLQAILLTSSLLLMLGMCASLMWLAAVRVPHPADAGQAQPSEPDA